MVVDTSVIVAILLREPKRREFYDKILDDGSVRISAVGYMEAGMILTFRFGDAAEQTLDQTLQDLGIAVVPSRFPQIRQRSAPAGLNFGDCFSYALAKSSAEPLLFEGSDFARTDITID